MIIRGREVGFRRTIGADVDIGEICPGRNLSNISELFGEDKPLGDNIGMVVKIMLILNKWYETTAWLNDPSHQINMLTEAEVLSLDEDDFAELQNEMMAAWAKDTKQSVEATPIKKNGRAVKSK